MWGSILKGIGKVGGGLLGLGGGTDYGKLIGALGAGLGGKAKDDATNRGEQFNGQVQLAQMLAQRDFARMGLEGQADRDFFDQGIRREEDGRASGQDAWRKLQSAQRTLSPGASPQLAGKYSVAPRQATDMERQGADAMTAEVMARLQGGNRIAAPTRRDVSMQYDPMSTIDPRLLQAGGMEKTSNWLAPILTYLGQIKKRPASDTMSGVPKGGNYA